MIRTTASNAMFMAVVALAASATVNCSRNNSADRHSAVGSVGLAVQLSPGVNVASVHYKVSGNSITPIEGDIAVADPAATVSVLINGIPAGTGYSIELSAVSADGKTTCAGKAENVTVVASQSTAVNVAIQCRGAKTRGTVLVNGTFNNCPSVDFSSASPLATAVGSKINLTTAASDLDAGATLTYAWTATGGSFAAAAAATTEYTCSAGGPQTLTLTVSDGNCTDVTTIAVNCIAVLCGNGAVDAASGETCDGAPVGGVACPADCTLPVCGDGVMEGGETCDDANTSNGDNCPSTCRLAVCGNSTVEAGEDCDPPAANSCSATCKFLSACGNGRVDQGETCDDGNTAAGDGCSPTCAVEAICGNSVVEAGEQCDPPAAGACSATCQTIVANDLCATCTTSNQCLANENTGCAIYAAGSAERTACEGLLTCERTSKCAALDPLAGPLGCFCGIVNGAVNLGDCTGSGPGQGPKGACKDLIFAATNAGTSVASVAERFLDPSFGAAGANNLEQCRLDNCRTQCF